MTRSAYVVICLFLSVVVVGAADRAEAGSITVVGDVNSAVDPWYSSTDNATFLENVLGEVTSVLLSGRPDGVISGTFDNVVDLFATAPGVTTDTASGPLTSSLRGS